MEHSLLPQTKRIRTVRAKGQRPLLIRSGRPQDLSFRIQLRTKAVFERFAGLLRLFGRVSARLGAAGWDQICRVRDMVRDITVCSISAARSPSSEAVTRQLIES